MANDATKNLSELAEVFKALGHPTRLWIVRNLAKGELCVCDFVEGTDEEFSSVSQHLNVLKKAHVVESEKRGKHVFYKLVYNCIPWLIDCMEVRNEVLRLSRAEQLAMAEKQRQDLISHLKSLPLE